MATGNYILDKGYNAAGEITKFRAVKLTAAETVGPVTGKADVVHGFAQFGVTTAEIARGKGASVRVEGITEAEASGAIAVGDIVTVDADGRVSSNTATNRIVGRCVGHPATNAGDRISLLINTQGGVA